MTRHSYDLNQHPVRTIVANGNRTGTGLIIGAYNRVSQDAQYTYLYDNEGNRIKRTDRTSGYWTEYVWDQRNRLTEVISKTNLGLVTQGVPYSYDVFDQRITKANSTFTPVTDDGDGTVMNTERHVSLTDSTPFPLRVLLSR